MPFEPPLRADLFPLEEPPRDELFEVVLELPLREALEPPLLADDPLEAAFFGAAFLIAFFATALFIAFFGAAFFAPLFFAAAFLGALFFAAAFFIPFLAALLAPPLEEVLEADLLPALFEDFEPPRRAAFLLADLDEDLLPPELLEADFFAAVFFFAFAILMGFE